MSLFGPKAVASLGLGFPDAGQVQLLDQSVLGLASQPPAVVVYPLMMAGKLFYNFGNARAVDVAQAAALEIRYRLDATTDRPSLLAVCTGGAPAWVEGVPAQRVYRADFVPVPGAPVLVPETHLSLGDEDYYHRLAIGACLDMASHYANERGREVAEAAERLMRVIASQGVPTPEGPVMLAYGAAVSVYGGA